MLVEKTPQARLPTAALWYIALDDLLLYEVLGQSDPAANSLCPSG